MFDIARMNELSSLQLNFTSIMNIFLVLQHVSHMQESQFVTVIINCHNIIHVIYVRGKRVDE